MTTISLKLKAITGITLLFFATMSAQAVWIGATNGSAYADTRNYTNTANWAGGIIDDNFTGVTLTGATTLYFTGDHATGPNGLNTSYAGPRGRAAPFPSYPFPQLMAAVSSPLVHLILQFPSL